MEGPPTQPRPGDLGFDTLYGLVVDSADPSRVEAHIAVRDELKQPFGIVHGGLYCAVAESLASIGTWLGVRDEGRVAMGLSNQTSFLRPVRDGVIRAHATPLHRGRTTWVWDVHMEDADGRPCAVSRMTIAVRDATPPA